MSRVEPDRPFLVTDSRSWTYGEASIEVSGRLTDKPRVITPILGADSVFDLIAGISGGGATVLPPHLTGVDAAREKLVVFTSGTSGPAKGVRLTMDNLTAAVKASARHLGHDASDTWLLAMPLHHVGGLSILVRQAWAGGAVRMLAGFDAEPFANALHEVTMVSVVATMLSRIVEHGPFRGLKAVLVGGGPIPEGLLERADAVGLPVLPTYGMTETFGQVATSRPGSGLERKVHPLPGVEIRIRDDGRIMIRGDQVSPGYLGEPDRQDPWFVTNDLGTLDGDGALRILGRADTVIVSGGENVSAEQVESVVAQHEEIEEAVVLGIPSPEWGEEVVCVYVGGVGAEELTRFVSERLPGLMVPKRWVSVDELPRNSIGKPDRAALRRLCLRADR